MVIADVGDADADPDALCEALGAEGDAEIDADSPDGEADNDGLRLPLALALGADGDALMEALGAEGEADMLALGAEGDAEIVLEAEALTLCEIEAEKLALGAEGEADAEALGPDAPLDGEADIDAEPTIWLSAPTSQSPVLVSPSMSVVKLSGSASPDVFVPVP